jgi:pyruvate/2-oxoglutarate dehydrogenase complex dihydrolipoamide acyltransferase (E2) component
MSRKEMRMPARQHPLILPDLGLGTAPVQASVWLARLGASVVCGDRVLEIVSGNVTVDLSAPASGRLIRQDVSEDDEVSVGQVLGVIEEEGS